MSKIAEDLIANKGKSIVVCDNNNENVQLLVNAINQELNNYGKTILIDNPSYLKQGSNNNVNSLIDKMNSNY